MRQKGLTLIELMIGVALIAMIIALAAPSIGVAIQNRQIRTTAESVLSGLQFAKTEALRRNRTVKFALAAGSWQVGCDPADDTVPSPGADPVCPGMLQKHDAQDGSGGAQVTASETVASSGSPAASPVFDGTALKFTPLGRVETSGSAPSLTSGNVATYTISNPARGTCAADGGDMRCLAVTVTWTGQIRMCDPAVASGDPRAC